MAFMTQLKSFDGTYWWCNWMELIERFAYYGVRVMLPDEGEMACGEYGPGRMAEPAAIFDAIVARLERGAGPLQGKHVLVTAGPTHEPLDPVRYLANRSSGRQGYAMAAALAGRCPPSTNSPPTALRTKYGIFSAVIHEAKPGDAETARITIIRDGLKREIAFTKDQPSILDAASAAGLEVPFSCTSGVCGTCRAKVLEGDVRMERNFALDKHEVAAGFVLTCQAHPITANVVLSFDER